MLLDELVIPPSDQDQSGVIKEAFERAVDCIQAIRHFQIELDRLPEEYCVDRVVEPKSWVEIMRAEQDSILSGIRTLEDSLRESNDVIERSLVLHTNSTVVRIGKWSGSTGHSLSRDIALRLWWCILGAIADARSSVKKPDKKVSEPKLTMTQMTEDGHFNKDYWISGGCILREHPTEPSRQQRIWTTGSWKYVRKSLEGFEWPDLHELGILVRVEAQRALQNERYRQHPLSLAHETTALRMRKTKKTLLRPTSITSKDRRRSKSTAPKVTLGNPDGLIIYVGEVEKKVSQRQYNVVQALVNAGSRGITKDQLDIKSGHTEARKVLVALRKKDEDWKRVIVCPGKAGNGGYRIAQYNAHS